VDCNRLDKGKERGVEMSKTEYRCIRCGSARIYWDAEAAWDSDNQRKVLAGSSDHAKCADCWNAGTIGKAYYQTIISVRERSRPC